MEAGYRKAAPRIRTPKATRPPDADELQPPPATPVAGRLSRTHRCRDAAGQQPRHVVSDLPAAQARGVARLDSNGPDLPLVPLHRGHHHRALHGVATGQGTWNVGTHAADTPARRDHIPARPAALVVPWIHLGSDTG